MRIILSVRNSHIKVSDTHVIYNSSLTLIHKYMYVDWPYWLSNHNSFSLLEVNSDQDVPCNLFLFLVYQLSPHLFLIFRVKEKLGDKVNLNMEIWENLKIKLYILELY